MIWAFVAVVIVSVFLAASASARVQTPQPERGDVPTVQDGKRIIRVYGTVWIDDPMQLAMQQVGTDAIRKKGGKK
ncbi:hypothetical protein [Fulvimonas yonginensis]|uniref:Uncharacterized protein n=1 Tax=Fulvimonas yonginensis TaxID=1495200 RepID=A0ABU8JAX0_9GAMM